MNISIKGYQSTKLIEGERAERYKLFLKVEGELDMTFYLGLNVDDNEVEIVCEYGEELFEEEFERRIKELTDETIQIAIEHPDLPEEIKQKLKSHRLRRAAMD